MQTALETQGKKPILKVVFFVSKMHININADCRDI